MVLVEELATAALAFLHVGRSHLEEAHVALDVHLQLGEGPEDDLILGCLRGQSLGNGAGRCGPYEHLAASQEIWHTFAVEVGHEAVVQGFDAASLLCHGEVAEEARLSELVLEGVGHGSRLQQAGELRVGLHEVGTFKHRLVFLQEGSFEGCLAEDVEILPRHLPLALDEGHARQVLQREQRGTVHRQFLHGPAHGRAHEAALEVAIDEVVVQGLLGVAAVGVGIDGVVLQTDIEELVREMSRAGEADGIVGGQGAIAQVGVLVARGDHPLIVPFHQLHLHPGDGAQVGVTEVKKEAGEDEQRKEKGKR